MILLAPLWTGGRAGAQPSPVTITPGLGHDRFTETFFLDDSSSINPDSLERIRKTQSDLQETYASMRLGLEFERWRLDNTVYATNKAWRSIANGHGRWSAGRWRTDFDGRLEWKGRSRSDSSAAAYTWARVGITPRWQWNENWSLVLAGDWELTDYRRNTSYTYDYNRLRAQAGLGYFGPQMEYLDVRIGVAHRTVPDSSEQGYTEDFLRLDAYGWRFGRWRVEGEFSVVIRDFGTPEDENDYSRWSVSTGIDYDWSPRWRTSVQTSWQCWDYRQPDELNYSLHDIRAEGGVRCRFNDVWETGAVVELRLERAVQDSLSENDYRQWAAGPRLVWNSGAAIWSELAPRAGYRDYAARSTIYDDYTFWEFIWQADMLCPARTTASATITYSSERHADRSRDADYLYVSVALRFPIRL